MALLKVGLLVASKVGSLVNQLVDLKVDLKVGRWAAELVATLVDLKVVESAVLLVDKKDCYLVGNLGPLLELCLVEM